jgi:hypothetical protein
MKRFFYWFSFVVLIFALVSTNSVLAQDPSGRPTGPRTPTSNPAPAPAPQDKPQDSGAGGGPTAASGQLINLSKFDSITALVFGVINYALVLLGVISTLMIIWGGFLMVMSAGNEERLTKGRQTLMWAIIGFVVALLAFSIVSIVQNVLQK